MQQTTTLLRRLSESGVEFIIVGGVAATLHGVGGSTYDLDIAAPFTRDNMARLLAALAPHHPRHRIMPGKPPIHEREAELASLKNLYVECDLGVLDIIGELPPVGGYREVAESAVEISVLGIRYRVIGIDELIRIKDQLGRGKDQETARELRAIRDRRGSE